MKLLFNIVVTLFLGMSTTVYAEDFTFDFSLPHSAYAEELYINELLNEPLYIPPAPRYIQLKRSRSVSVRERLKQLRPRWHFKINNKYDASIALLSSRREFIRFEMRF